MKIHACVYIYIHGRVWDPSGLHKSCANAWYPTIILPNLEEAVASAQMNGVRVPLLDQFVMNVSDVVVRVVDVAVHWRASCKDTAILGDLYPPARETP